LTLTELGTHHPAWFPSLFLLFPSRQEALFERFKVLACRTALLQRDDASSARRLAENQLSQIDRSTQRKHPNF
jgi:hypothetical protein